MKFKRKIYKIIRFVKGGIEYYYNLIEDTDGLYAEELQEDGSILRTKIGNFFLKYIKVDDNDKNEHSSKILHYFQVYYREHGEDCLAEKCFCYRNGQYVTAKIESSFPYGVYLDSTTKEVLDYFKGYLKELIRNGVEEDGSYVRNEATIQNVKEFLIHFMELIQGRENLFFEMGFKRVYGKDNEINRFYDEYTINDDRDLFLVSRTIYENYKKIGFYHPKKKCYIMELRKLRQVMLEECQERMTAKDLNDGLKSLNLIGCRYCFKSTSTKYYANLTGLYVDKLIALAYPNGIPDAPNDELEPIEETQSNTMEEEDPIDDDNDDNDDESVFEGLEDINIDEEEKKMNYDDFVESLGL